MGWLKRLLFGAESVTKSAGRKAKETARDLGEDIVDKTGDAFDKAKDVAGDLSEKVYDKADDAFDKFKDFAEDVGEVVKEKSSEYFEKAKDVAEDLGEKVVEKTGDVYEKAKDVAEDLGENIHKKTDQLKDKAKSFTERKEIEVEPSPTTADDDFDALVEDTLSGSDIEKTAAPIVTESVRKAAKEVNLEDNSGSKVDEVIDKAKEVYSKFDEHAQKTIDVIDEKARDVIDKIDDKVEEMLKPKQSEFADTPLDTGKSTLEGTDDFFEKAAKFADGDYSDDPNITSHVKGETIDLEAEIVDEIKEEEIIETGEDAFRDHDGDGDPYIDDAIISEEE